MFYFKNNFTQKLVSSLFRLYMQNKRSLGYKMLLTLSIVYGMLKAYYEVISRCIEQDKVF